MGILLIIAVVVIGVVVWFLREWHDFVNQYKTHDVEEEAKRVQ